jgi:hypothetical protein
MSVDSMGATLVDRKVEMSEKMLVAPWAMLLVVQKVAKKVLQLVENLVARKVRGLANLLVDKKVEK